jgi:outer membrane protein assembly factor BamB
MRPQNKNITVVVVIALLVMLFIATLFYKSVSLINSNSQQKNSGIFLNMPVVWKIRTSEDVISSLVQDEKNIYFRTTAFVYALGGQTGKEIWKYPSRVPDGFALPPYIADSYLVVPETDSSITILKKDTGELVWQSGPPQSNFTSSENLAVENVGLSENIVLATRFSWNLTAYDLLSGNSLWEFDLPSRTNPYMVINNGVVFLGVGQQLIAIEAETGKILWQLEIPGYVGNLFFDEDENNVIVADVEGPSLLFVDPEKGKIMGRKDLNISSEFGINCMIDYGDNLIVSADGLSIISKSTGIEEWHVNNVGHLECPVIIGDKLFVRNTGTRLFSYDLVNGINLGEMVVGANTPMAHEPNRSPVSLDGLFIVPVSDNELIAYRP